MRHSLTHQELQVRPLRALSSRLCTIGLISPSDKPRFSCVISKKVAQKAVDRNRARRRFRSALRAISQPGLFVVHIKKPALEASFTDLKNDMHALLKRFAS